MNGAQVFDVALSLYSSDSLVAVSVAASPQVIIIVPFTNIYVSL